MKKFFILGLVFLLGNFCCVYGMKNSARNVQGAFTNVRNWHAGFGELRGQDLSAIVDWTHVQIGIGNDLGKIESVFNQFRKSFRSFIAEDRELVFERMMEIAAENERKYAATYFIFHMLCYRWSRFRFFEAAN